MSRSYAMIVMSCSAAVARIGPRATPSIEATTRMSAPSLIMFWIWEICWSTLLSAYCRLVS